MSDDTKPDPVLAALARIEASMAVFNTQLVQSSPEWTSFRTLWMRSSRTSGSGRTGRRREQPGETPRRGIAGLRGSAQATKGATPPTPNQLPRNDTQTTVCAENVPVKDGPLRPLAAESEHGAKQDCPSFVTHAGRDDRLQPVRQHLTRDLGQRPDRLAAGACEIEHQAVSIAGNVLAVGDVEVEVVAHGS